MRFCRPFLITCFGSRPQASGGAAVVASCWGDRFGWLTAELAGANSAVSRSRDEMLMQVNYKSLARIVFLSHIYGDGGFIEP